jgi:glycine cleavage system aminomethyltransferase T
MGYIPTELVSSPSGFEIEIIGKRRPAAILHEAILDPSGSRMRA